MSARTCSDSQRDRDRRNLVVAMQRLGRCRGCFGAHRGADPVWIRKRLRKFRKAVKAKRREARANRKRNGRQR